MTALPAICLAGVSWKYAGGDAPALDALDLTIDRGEIVVLTGASGSGKSTALRLMNGLIPHLHNGILTGEVQVLGTSTGSLDLADFGHRTGSVWQHPFRQFFASTVSDEIAFILENHAEPPGGIRHRIHELLRDDHLTHLRNRRLSTLSSGQQQLVATLAAIAHRPPILLLDEPTANLSDDAAARLIASLRRLRHEGRTIVLAEHRIHPFVPLADRIVHFRDGHIDISWTPETFARLTDTELLAHGLRPRTTPPSRAKPAAATGRSIAAVTSVLDRRPSESPTYHDAPHGGVTLEGIRCSRDGQVIIDIDHAHLPAGRVTVLRGANGTGKTTLARIIVGLQAHTGKVMIDGATTSRGRRRRDSMLITQEVQRQLFADTVRAELELAVTDRPHGVDPAAVLAQLDLQHLQQRHPLSLSGGQQQRLAVAVARLGDRHVIVLDEPSTGVDARHLSTISRLITGLADAGSTVILITHDAHLLGRTADHELTLEEPSKNPPSSI